MTFTKQQKIFGAVLALAAVALAVDRFVLDGGPAPAEASPQDLLIARPDTSLAISTSPPAFPAGTDKPGAAFSRRLRDVADQKRIVPTRIPDSFTPADAWAKRTAPDHQPDALSATAHFAAAHELTGVMASGHRSIAVVDGKSLLIGQVLDGFKLISVDRTSATFAGDGGSVILRLPAPPSLVSP